MFGSQSLILVTCWLIGMGLFCLFYPISLTDSKMSTIQNIILFCVYIYYFVLGMSFFTDFSMYLYGNTSYGFFRGAYAHCINRLFGITTKTDNLLPFSHGVDDLCATFIFADKSAQDDIDYIYDVQTDDTALEHKNNVSSDGYGRSMVQVAVVFVVLSIFVMAEVIDLIYLV